jgi:hypothetical protein
MNILHVVGLPHSVTEAELVDVFSAFGPVVSAKTIKDQNGKNTGAAIVEMYHSGDVHALLASTDSIAVKGKRPHMWKPAHAVTLTDLMSRQDCGIYAGQNRGRWYVYELHNGRLRWCQAFATEQEATAFYTKKRKDGA